MIYINNKRKGYLMYMIWLSEKHQSYITLKVQLCWNWFSHDGQLVATVQQYFKNLSRNLKKS